MDFFYIAISSPKAQECCCKEQYLIYCKINFQEGHGRICQNSSVSFCVSPAVWEGKRLSRSAQLPSSSYFPPCLDLSYAVVILFLWAVRCERVLVPIQSREQEAVTLCRWCTCKELPGAASGGAVDIPVLVVRRFRQKLSYLSVFCGRGSNRVKWSNWPPPSGFWWWWCSLRERGS